MTNERRAAAKMPVASIPLHTLLPVPAKQLLLHAADPRFKPDAVERASRAASTLYSLGFITNPDTTFRITPTGRLALVELAVGK